MKKNNYRIEQDSLGKIKVPQNALYGAQTQRAVDNFKISGITFDPAFIQALASLKNACASANVKCKVLPKVKASTISNISKKISSNPLDFSSKMLFLTNAFFLTITNLLFVNMSLLLRNGRCFK